jgi:basic membrane protein A
MVVVTAGTLLLAVNLLATPAPTSSRSPAAPSGSAASPGTPRPSWVHPIGSIVLVTALEGSAPGSASALAWTGVAEAASALGASMSRVEPRSMADLSAAPAAAAAGGAAVVVTVGPDAAPAALAAAQAHPATQFFEIDQTVPDGAPANLHGLVFDEAEGGYLAGVVAASVSAGGNIAMVGDTASDTRSANYAAGFRSGARFVDPNVKVAIAYAGEATSPYKGRSAAANLVKAGADVVLALPSLSGIGAMREACARKALVIAADVDAWLTVADVRPCLVVSIRKRFDVAVSDAILAYAAGEPVANVTVADVASGGIDVTEFHTAVPDGLAAQLSGVIEAMRSGPPRPTPTPTLPLPSASAT